jgi:2-polyprenyl-3-methyl-5-hydroxy-6-metoxy-1,4-benzoquinol methylase
MLYETPWTVERPEGARFYHRMTLPEIGEVDGYWDLRDCTDAYLGNYNFQGKRVLDVGAASGFLSFAMEERGAEVVSFDIDDGANWDIVPNFQRDEGTDLRTKVRDSVVQEKKAYWFSHRLLNSQARVHYGNIYAMDDRLGEFDVVFYGMILGHLRDIYQALHEGAKRCREAIIVTSIFQVDDTPRAIFTPRPDQWDERRARSWWSQTTGLMKAMLGTLGFQVVDIVKSEPIVAADSGIYTEQPTCHAVVAKRI